MKKQLLLLSALIIILLTGCQTNQVLTTAENPLYRAIEVDLAANRLTKPTDNNAMEKVDHLAATSPDDPRIAQYRSRITDKLVILGQQAFLNGHLNRARQLAFRAIEITPDHEEAGYILAAVAEASQPTQLNNEGKLVPTESFEIETVEESESAEVNIISVIAPDLDSEVIPSTAETE